MIKNENMINIGIFLFGGILIATIVILLVRKPWEKYNQAPSPTPSPPHVVPPSAPPFPCDSSWCKGDCHCTEDGCTKNLKDPCYPCDSSWCGQQQNCWCDPKWEGTQYPCQEIGGGPCSDPGRSHIVKN